MPNKKLYVLQSKKTNNNNEKDIENMHIKLALFFK
jgi:hypothetical protein